MLNIASILAHVYSGLKANLERYIVIDDEHVLDIATGVKYHLYDDWYKVSHDEKVLLKKDQFTKDEQEILWKVKKLITDPEKSKRLAQEYPKAVQSSRERFSKLYEHPVPVPNKFSSLESGTEEYKG